MITLTEKAVEMLKLSLAQEGLGADYGLRVAVIGRGCSGIRYSLELDNVTTDDDQVVEQHGIRLIIDPLSREYLEGVTIDYVSSLHGAGFRFLNQSIIPTGAHGNPSRA
jgi:iron-sulfur cluster assembly protein